MRTILVASSKGGVGKTTLATQLAARYAGNGKATVLIDADPQGSASRWCQRREGHPAAVFARTARDAMPELPAGCERVLIDAPAGAQPDALGPYLEAADAVLVPVLPSAIDLEATVPFLNAMARIGRVRKGRLAVALVANRIKPWTQSSQQALAQLESWPWPLAARLRDSQAYVLLAALGRGVFDYQSEQMRSHQDDFAPLLRWLKQHT